MACSQGRSLRLGAELSVFAGGDECVGRAEAAGREIHPACVVGNDRTGGDQGRVADTVVRYASQLPFPNPNSQLSMLIYVVIMIVTCPTTNRSRIYLHEQLPDTDVVPIAISGDVE
eukprot:955511-Pleurochrysis_carterae.AAC.3